MAVILAYSPERSVVDSLSAALETEDAQVLATDSRKRAFTFLRSEAIDVALWDFDESRITVRSVSETLQNYRPNAVLLCLASEPDAELARTIVETSGCDLMRKGASSGETLVRVQRALDKERLKNEAQTLRGERDIIYRTEDFVAESPAILDVLDMVKRVAPQDSTVLLVGETGTGKELIAGAIHYNSPRASRAYVRVNCASLPATLLESELFGHEKGAFTGAHKRRIGRFEQADGGSILLDEISEMSFDTQAKLLRVIQERQFQRVGGSTTVNVDVRIIAATNKDLAEQVAAGAFREDLYYRLNVVPLFVPPMRERREDILPLARYFLHKHAKSAGRRVPRLHPEAEEALVEHSWPGNVRELQNVVERAVILTDSEVLRREDLDLVPAQPFAQKREAVQDDAPAQLPPGGVDLEEVEASLILQALERANWVQKDAARLLGLSARALNYRIGKYGITHQTWKRNRTRESGESAEDDGEQPPEAFAGGPGTYRRSRKSKGQRSERGLGETLDGARGEDDRPLRTGFTRSEEARSGSPDAPKVPPRDKPEERTGSPLY